MSVLVRYQEVGMTRQQYDEVGGLLEQGEFPPAGLELHLLFGEEGSLRVSEVWATEDQQRVQRRDADASTEPGWRPTERRT